MSPSGVDRPGLLRSPLPPPPLYAGSSGREETAPSSGRPHFHYGAVELPPSSIADDDTRASARAVDRGSVLHATVEPGGAALCGEVTGRLVPTFRRWSANHLGCLTLCPTCSAIAPPKRRRLLTLPSLRVPEPGAECFYRPPASLVVLGWLFGLGWIVVYCLVWVYVDVRQANASEAQAVAAGLGAVLFVAAPSVWVLWRSLWVGTAVGVDGVTRFGFWRARFYPWHEIQSFCLKLGKEPKVALVTIWNEVVVLPWASVGGGFQPHVPPEPRVQALNQAFTSDQAGPAALVPGLDGHGAVPAMVGGDDSIAIDDGPPSPKLEGAVEAPLTPRDTAVPFDDGSAGRRLVHAVLPGSLRPICEARPEVLLSTFKRWGGSIPRRCSHCPACAELAPHRGLRVETAERSGPATPHVGSSLWTYRLDGRGVRIVAFVLLVVTLVLRLRWQWTPNPNFADRSVTFNLVVSALWCAVVGPVLVWLAWSWRRRLDVGPDGFTVVSWRRHRVPWSEVRDFARHGRAGVAIVTDSASWKAPLPDGINRDPGAAWLFDQAFGPVCERRLVRTGDAEVRASWDEVRSTTGTTRARLQLPPPPGRAGPVFDPEEMPRLRRTRREAWLVAGVSLALMVLVAGDLDRVQEPKTTAEFYAAAGEPVEIPGTITTGAPDLNENISFRYLVGGVNHHASSYKSSDNSYQDGERVTIVVDALRPDRAIVDGESASASWWYFLDILAVLGGSTALLVAVVMVVVVTVQLLRRRARAKPQPLAR